MKLRSTKVWKNLEIKRLVVPSYPRRGLLNASFQIVPHLHRLHRINTLRRNQKLYRTIKIACEFL